MITLKTLANATAQEVYDQVATHLLTQKKRSINERNACRYLGQGGLKCAAGCLIAEDEYSLSMEEKAWHLLVFNGEVPTSEHSYMIGKLQKIHDSQNPAVWPEKLTKLALEFELKPVEVFA